MELIRAYKNKAGRVFVYDPILCYWILSANCVEPTVLRPTIDVNGIPQFLHSLTIDTMVNSGQLEAVDLMDLSWIHPHLTKNLKQVIKKYDV